MTDREGLGRFRSRSKKIRKVDVSNPLSTFRKQVRQRKQYLIPSKFAKEEWMGLRRMDADGKFIQQEDNKADEWKNVAKSDRLVRRNAGDVFADTRLDDGLHAIVDKDSTSEEKKLAKQQKTMGAIAHLTLQAMENYTILYKKIEELVMWSIGDPRDENSEWTGEEDTEHARYVYSEVQNQYYAYFRGIQREFQVDLAEPLANVTRIAAESFTKALDERQEKVIYRIKKTNSKAASAITRIPPSAHFMFGGDHSRLAKVVELTKDLSSTANRNIFTTPKDKPKYRGGHGDGAGKTRDGPGEVVESTVAEVVVPTGVLAGTRREGLRLKGVTIPFVGETPTGGERTKFLPRTSKDYFKPHQVPQCWPWAKDTICNNYPARTVHSGSTDKALERLASGDRRLLTSHRGRQDATDRQTSCTLRFQSGIRREEGGPSYRRGRQGSV